ncbi:MAG: hypothetical protein VX705_08625 [Verrucomicrobiota bacterium]|nr:hypothetical protein [Verrucomicrobiota bacterium]
MQLMRRFLPLIAVGTMAGGCGGETKSLVGTWHKANTSTEKAENKPEDDREKSGGKFPGFVFNENGTGSAKLKENTILKFNWETKGDLLILKTKPTQPGKATTEKSEFDLDGDQLTLTFGGQTLKLKRD